MRVLYVGKCALVSIAHTETHTKYVFPTLTYQSIHQYLIETINLSLLLEPHFVDRCRFECFQSKVCWGFCFKAFHNFTNMFCKLKIVFINRNRKKCVDVLFIFPPSSFHFHIKCLPNSHCHLLSTPYIMRHFSAGIFL